MEVSKEKDSIKLSSHDPFSSRAVLDHSFSALALRRTPFSRGHPSASAFFRHFDTSWVRFQRIAP
jgi:hypothetical protein